MRTALIAAALVALAGCSNPAPISSNPVTTTTNIIGNILPGANSAKADISTQLVNAEYNLDQGVAIGVLQSGDPVDACLHQVNTQLGIEPGSTAPPAASFTPRMTGLIDSGAAAYILAQQANSAKNGGIAVPPGCKAVIGDLVLKGAAGAINLVPGGGILPVLK